MTAESSTRGSRVAAAIERWDPVYFALVMATGIVAVAAQGAGFGLFGRVLLGVTVCAYVVVAALTLVRVARFPRSSLTDVTSHERGPASFTAVAGTCVLGAAALVFDGPTVVALWLFALGAVLWLALTYAVAAGLTMGGVDESIPGILDGTWFLSVVATQSLAVLAGLLSVRVPAIADALLFAALGLFGLGGGLYLVVTTLVGYRMAFFELDPTAATPPYWINMGAVAISTLAGATLLDRAADWALLASAEPFVLGATVACWAAATWWIPLLVALGVWRHATGNVPLPHAPDGYAPSYWGMVFPVGMYAVATDRLAATVGLDPLAAVTPYGAVVAVAVWFVVSLGLVRTLVATRT